MNIEVYCNRQQLQEGQEGYLIELNSSESGTVYFFESSIPRTVPGDRELERGFLGTEQRGNYRVSRKSHGKHRIKQLSKFKRNDFFLYRVRTEPV